MRRLGKLLSCFVTERKHQSVKDAALHVFRHMEHTVVLDVVNLQCQQISREADLFKARFLVNARTVYFGDTRFYSAKSAVLEIGHIQADDIVYCSSGVAGRVCGFWGNGEEIVVEFDAFACVLGDTRLRSEQHPTRCFVDHSEVLEACVWVYERPSVIRLCLPPSALFQ